MPRKPVSGQKMTPICAIAAALTCVRVIIFTCTFKYRPHPEVRRIAVPVSRGSAASAKAGTTLAASYQRPADNPASLKRAPGRRGSRPGRRRGRRGSRIRGSAGTGPPAGSGPFHNSAPVRCACAREDPLIVQDSAKEFARACLRPLHLRIWFCND